MWRVISGTTVVEKHATPWEAQRAAMVLTAHEMKNGRVANYRVDPPIDPYPINALRLPDWAIEVLKDMEHT